MVNIPKEKHHRRSDALSQDEFDAMLKKPTHRRTEAISSDQDFASISSDASFASILQDIQRSSSNSSSRPSSPLPIRKNSKNDGLKL